jgi:hypothetical protein
MARNFILIPMLGAMFFLSACGKEKTEAEKADEERGSIREEKRKKAAEVYRTFAKEYPDDPQAAEATKKAAALDAMAPKK